MTKKTLGLSLFFITGLALFYFFNTCHVHEITVDTFTIDGYLQDKTSWTPLMHAAYEGNTQKIKGLIAQGANVNAEPEIPHNMVGSIHRLSPLALAIVAKSLNSVLVLLQAGANVQEVFGAEFPGIGIPILGFALDSASMDIIMAIIDAGANVNQFIQGGIFDEKSVRNNPLLTYAIVHKMPGTVIQLLIQHGANVNQMDYFKIFSPLHIAAATGQADIVRNLLTAGADKNLKNAQGKTPLDFAKKYCHNNIARILSQQHCKNVVIDYKSEATTVEAVASWKLNLEVFSIGSVCIV